MPIQTYEAELEHYIPGGKCLAGIRLGLFCASSGSWRDHRN